MLDTKLLISAQRKEITESPELWHKKRRCQLELKVMRLKVVLVRVHSGKNTEYCDIFCSCDASECSMLNERDTCILRNQRAPPIEVVQKKNYRVI